MTIIKVGVDNERNTFVSSNYHRCMKLSYVLTYKVLLRWNNARLQEEVSYIGIVVL